MKIKDLPVGTIFTVPSMPQWGIMMISLLRNSESTTVFVSLTGNCWTHLKNPTLDDELEVQVLPELHMMINHVKASVMLKHYSEWK